jgi:hypothetical protein
MVQEAYDTHPAIRRACDIYIGAHAAEAAKDIAAAKAPYAHGGVERREVAGTRALKWGMEGGIRESSGPSVPCLPPR